MSGFNWQTDGAVDELSRLWLLGKSASICAAILSIRFNNCFTRNAVVGKVYRLGLPGHITTVALPTTHKTPRRQRHAPINLNRLRPPRPRKMKPRPIAGDLLAESIPVEQRKTIFELENHHCRWIYGDPQSADHFYCGSPAADLGRAKPYCDLHMWRSCQESEPIEAAAA